MVQVPTTCAGLNLLVDDNQEQVGPLLYISALLPVGGLSGGLPRFGIRLSCPTPSSPTKQILVSGSGGAMVLAHCGVVIHYLGLCTTPTSCFHLCLQDSWAEGHSHQLLSQTPKQPS